MVIGLALFITFFIMTPAWQAVYQDALKPYLEKEISYREAFEAAQIPVRQFMLKNTREKDIALFVKASHARAPRTREDLSLLILIPAFVISELKTASVIGFVVYMPFIIIDMVVASILLTMGMMMLPPVMISLPFKLMLFVLVDGWNMVIGSMIKSFGIVGAATSTSISYAFGAGLFFIAYCRSTGASVRSLLVPTKVDFEMIVLTPLRKWWKNR